MLSSQRRNGGNSTSEYFPKWDVFVRYEKLPPHVDGFACCGQGAEGIDQIAVINDELTGDRLVAAVAHEIHHYVRDRAVRRGRGREDDAISHGAHGFPHDPAHIHTAF